MHSVLLRVFLCSVASCLAQSDRTGFIGVYAGVAYPIKQFAATSFQDSGAGFARRGLSCAVQFANQLGLFGGFSLLYHYQSNGIDALALIRAYETANPGRTYTVHWGSPWIKHAFMAGYFYCRSMHSENRVYFDLSVLIGYSRVRSPDLMVSESGTPYKRYYYSPLTGSGLGAMCTAGLRAAVGNSLALQIQAGLSPCTAQFKSTTETLTQKMLSLVVNGGLVFCF